jgi:hypothetical protein
VLAVIAACLLFVPRVPFTVAGAALAGAVAAVHWTRTGKAIARSG